MFHFNRFTVTHGTVGFPNTLYADDYALRHSSYQKWTSSLVTLSFYKGTMPTQAEADVFVSANRASDYIGYISGDMSTIYSVTLNGEWKFNFGATTVNIVNPGIVGWCVLTGNDVSNSVKFFMSLGLEGSGADYIIPNTNFTVGAIINLTDFKFKVIQNPTYLA